MIQYVEVNDSKIRTPNHLRTKHHHGFAASSQTWGVILKVVSCCCYYVDTEESCMAPSHSLRRLNNTGNILGRWAVWVLLLYCNLHCFCFSLPFKRTDGDLKSLINSRGNCYRVHDSTDASLHSPPQLMFFFIYLFVRKCDVVNRGLSGYNTRWAKIVLPRIVPISDAPIAAVTVFFGANDCALEGKSMSHVVHHLSGGDIWDTFFSLQTRTPRSTCLSGSSQRIWRTLSDIWCL